MPGAQVPGMPAGSEEALARLVHDLHAPLTVIRGLCATLVRDEPRADRRRGLALIDGEALRLAAGLEGIARSAAPSDWSRRPVHLAPLAVSVAERHRALAAERDARVVARRHRAAPIVEAEPDALRRLLDNLVQNALRHCVAEVRLVVGTRGGTAQVVVRDDGPGVPVGDRERIFWPRERGRAPVGPGRGLGLAIAREIAHAHGGSLTLDPTGPGAAFRLSLPLAGAPAPEPLAA